MITVRTRIPRGRPRAPGDLHPMLERLSMERRRQPQDTEQGCRDFAAADLARADDLVAGWPRARMEHSAAAWTARADLLHRVRGKADASKKPEECA